MERKLIDPNRSLKQLEREMKNLKVEVHDKNESWRLPSKEELNLMHKNLHKKGVGGFANGGYWSSSEQNANHAWVQYFYDGEQGFNFKYFDRPVRAVKTINSKTLDEIRWGTEEYIIFWKSENSYKVCKPDDEQGLFTWDQAIELFKENHGTKKLNQLLDKAKLMSIDEYGKLELQSRKKEIKQDWKDNAPDMDYTDWLEEQLIFFIDQFREVNKESLNLVVEKHMKTENRFSLYQYCKYMNWDEKDWGFTCEKGIKDALYCNKKHCKEYTGDDRDENKMETT